MAEGLAEKPRNGKTFVGPEEGSTKDQVTLGVSAGTCLKDTRRTRVGGMGSGSVFPFPSTLSGRSDFTSWSSDDYGRLPLSLVEVVEGTLGTLQGSVARLPKAAESS